MGTQHHAESGTAAAQETPVKRCADFLAGLSGKGAHLYVHDLMDETQRIVARDVLAFSTGDAIRFAREGAVARSDGSIGKYPRVVRHVAVTAEWLSTRYPEAGLLEGMLREIESRVPRSSARLSGELGLRSLF
jgi:hypothetical protein